MTHCIGNKYDCCGCSACVQICPEKCISFEEDKYGFRYPKVSSQDCIDCGLCDKVCLYKNIIKNNRPIFSLAAQSYDDSIRRKSSSGGIFTLLAEKVIEDGGVVFGACFDSTWNVVHDFTETKMGIERFRASKYVQSIIGNAFQQTRDFLNKDRLVLFSGTPCQIAGLKLFLRKDYTNLITISLACHGVPSPLVWRTYLKQILNKHKYLPSDVKTISFRDKSSGWRRYNFKILFKDSMGEVRENHCDNLYMRIFLHDLDLRPSCFQCPVKGDKIQGDIMLADYWGVSNFHPKVDDDKGTSAIVVFTEKGQGILDQLSFLREETRYEDIISTNTAIVRSVNETFYTKLFWRIFFKEGISSTSKVLKLKDKVSEMKYNINMVYKKIFVYHTISIRR